MDDTKNSHSGNYGGKTAGAAGGGLVILATSLLPEGHELKPYLVYFAPVVAVFCKDWGGALLFQVKLYFVFKWQHYRINNYKKRVDSIPDHPDYEQVKKEANKDYIEAMGGLLKSNINGVKRLSQLLDEKDPKATPELERDKA